MNARPRKPAPDPQLLALLIEETARVLDKEPGLIGPHQHLQHDLGLDSVMLLQLKGHLETRLPYLRDVPLPDLLVGDHTVGALAGRLQRLVAGPSGPGRGPATASVRVTGLPVA
ncbi:acyl carrier protein [Streptomyces sp. NPDC050418]|uniref:acyl carrier protein n=1 Tax=Streptomyces sp. NPDC050418 TaxID=3365612 RepID=UPI00379EBA93